MSKGLQVWFNGKLIPEESARISLFTHTLHYGVGAFEGIRAYRQTKGGGGIFRLQDHLQRLFESCKILGLNLPFTLDQLTEACISVCKANGFEECYIRPLVYIAEGPLGVNPGTAPPVSVAIMVWEWGKYLGGHGSKDGDGVRLKISSFIRPHVNASMTRGKIVGQYVNSVLAKREAAALGFDEALLLDAEGYLTEGTGENLFMVKKGIVKTTPLTSILNGITRQTVIDFLLRQGTPVVESRFTRDELWCADEVFLTGTAAEITPVKEIDHRLIGPQLKAGETGPITQKIVQAYQEMVRGELPSHGKDWITRI